MEWWQLTFLQTADTVWSHLYMSQAQTWHIDIYTRRACLLPDCHIVTWRNAGGVTGEKDVKPVTAARDCVPIFILPWVHLNVVHYPHLISTQISAGECCSKSNTPWFPYRKLRSWQPPRLVTRQKHPSLNGEQKKSTTLLFNSYNPTIWLRCRRCRLVAI